MQSKRHIGESGFTLIEILIALTIMTLITVIVLGALAPWLTFKQAQDTDRKLQDLRQGLTAYYDTNAMAIDTDAAGNFGLFTTSVQASGTCAPQPAGFQSISSLISESGQMALRDGFGNDWCIFVSQPLFETRDGTSIWYRNIAIVSPGKNSLIEPGTGLDGQGKLTTAGDDRGIVINGFNIEYAKYKELTTRLTRISSMYETYFTTRFLASANRDITVDYFNSKFDSGNGVPPTNGKWSDASAFLAGVGILPNDTLTPWDALNTISNSIQIGNTSETVNGATVRSPDSTGIGVLPYTSLIRAQLPAPPGQTLYVVRSIVGNY